MLPALELDGRLITESDEILIALEQAFGPLGASMVTPKVRGCASWSDSCSELVHLAVLPRFDVATGSRAREQFQAIAQRMEQAWWLVVAAGWIRVTRCSAARQRRSGVHPLRRAHECFPRLLQGFFLAERIRGSSLAVCMEGLETYRGTQSDFHTHAHDLPPQMGAVGPMVLRLSIVLRQPSTVVMASALGRDARVGMWCWRDWEPCSLCCVIARP